jgi:hypothetical protein
MNKNNILIILSLLIAAWWFRYDTHCTQNGCLSYDRFKGEWFITAELLKENNNE